ncbi:MAG: zinc-binding dehydrogenase [Verrucomicrobia bacterium]|nr:zinc-binding dehydrogenase [Verrucomicrobiota bacterium]
MKAVQLLAHGKPGQFRFGEVPDPAPATDEVVVRVRACGVNHLDLWCEQGELPLPIQLPRIGGGEVAGEILALGADVDQWRVGDRVAVQSNLFCGTCEFCLRGEDSNCLNARLLGVQCDGGFAERVKVPARCVVRLPEAVSFETSAALTLAGSTAMHMLTDRAEVRARDWVLVIGAASGVGSAAIQIAKQLGGRVIATASTPAKRELAQRLGAEFVVDSTKADWPSEVRKITDKRGVDLVVEHTGGAVLQAVFHCLARGGTVVTCGATGGREVPMQLWPFFVKQHRLIGSYGRNRSDLNATLEWAADGRLKPVIHQLFSLKDLSAAFAMLRSRQVLGKLVIKP